MPFASTSPAPKSARKRAGTVSRFFASSEYSAVPSKAIAGTHGKKGGSRWRSGRSPSTPIRWRHRTPTLPHKATPFAQKFPQMPPFAPFAPEKPSVHRGSGSICGISDECPYPAIRRADGRSAMCRADEGRFCPAGVPPTIFRVTTTPSLSPRRLAVLAAATLAIPIAGCGSSDTSASGTTDPAKAIPASAPFYLEATVKPTGKQKADLEAALGKILRTDDPAGKITQLIDKNATNGQTFDKDVKPWLGDKAAVAVTGAGVGAGATNWAVVINSTDDAKANDA